MAGSNDCDPYVAVRLARERADHGQPTGWYTLIGERECWERHRRVTAVILFAQDDQHLLSFMRDVMGARRCLGR